MRSMRTTVNLDDEIDATVRALARERRITFRAALHAVLRAGLEPRPAERVAYELPAWDLGVRPEVDVNKALSLATALEDDATVRKLELRK